MHRRAVIAAIAALILIPALAGAEEGGEKKEKKSDRLPNPEKGVRYARLPTIPLELYDKNGGYHMTTLDLLLMVPEAAKFSEKRLSDGIRKELNVIPFEEYAQPKSGQMIKDIAIEVARKTPGSEQVIDILISKILVR